MPRNSNYVRKTNCFKKMDKLKDATFDFYFFITGLIQKVFFTKCHSPCFKKTLILATAQPDKYYNPAEPDWTQFKA